jgi:glutamyl-tRNA synthetase
MNWTDPKTGELTEGFKEKGFLPEAFINLLALLGWNDGTQQEIFTKEELIQKFSIERVHSGGAKFDYEKGKWFNHEWIKRLQIADLRSQIERFLPDRVIDPASGAKLEKVIALVKDRCMLLTDFAEQSKLFFESPDRFDTDAVKPKWNEQKQFFFAEIIRNFELTNDWNAVVLEKSFKEIAAANQIKPGDVLLPFRVMLVGGKFGPGVFDIAAIIGKEETIKRMNQAIKIFG